MIYKTYQMVFFFDNIPEKVYSNDILHYNPGHEMHI